MTTYPYAGDGRPRTGPSYRAMAILGVLTGLIIGILLGLAEYAAAAPADQPLCRGCPTAAEAKRLNDFLAKQSPPPAVKDAPVALRAPVVEPPAPPPPPPVIAPATPAVVTPPPAAPPVTQNTVATTGPVTSSTTISVGTIAGQVLAWIAATFSVPIGGLAVWIMTRVLKNLGITATDAMRARLQDIVVNALNVSAPVVESQLAGKGQVEIHNEAVAKAITYVQSHGADTIKALGLNPNSPQAIEAIRARIETAIADPTVPTPAALDPQKPAPVAPAPAA